MPESVTPTENWPSRSLLAGLLLLAAFVPLAWSKTAMSTYFAPKFALLGIIVIWLLAAVVLRVVWSGEIRVPRAAHLAMFAFTAWAGLATLMSASPTVSFVGRANYGEGMISIFSYAIILYAASSVDWTETHWRRLGVAFAVGAAGVIVISLLQLSGRDDLLLQLGLVGMGVRGRISGSLGNPVFLGGYATLALPLVAALALRVRGRLWAVACGALAVGLLFLALASFTRASWLGIAAGLVVFIALGASALRDETRARALVLAGVMIVLSAVTITTFSTTRAGTMTARIASMARPAEGSASMRPSHWAVAAQMVASKPVTGWGPAQFRVGFDRYATLKQLQLEASTSDDAHNLLLNAAATTGVVGAILLLIALGAIVGGTIRDRRASSEAATGDASGAAAAAAAPESLGSASLFFASAAAAASGYLVWSMFNPSSAGITPLFWLVAGTLIPVRMYARDAEEGTTAQFKLLATIVTLGAAVAMAALPLRYLAADQQALAGIIAKSPDQLLSAISLDPYVPPYYWELAKAYRQQALDTQTAAPLNEAEIVMTKAVRLSPEFDAYITMASVEVLAAEGARNPDIYRLAVKNLQKALAARPLSGIARFNLGFVYYQLGDHKNAAKWLREATRIPPPDAKSYVLLGQSLEQLKKTKEAAAAYRAALKVQPDNAEAKKSLDRLP